MHRRRQKLIQTRLQLRVTMWFVGLTGLLLTLQYFVLAERMSTIGMELPNDSQLFFRDLNGELMKSFLATLGIALSLATAAGILLTHRIAGPAFRFDQFLKAVLRGEHPGECRIRRHDEFQDLCELLNQVTAEQRAESKPSEQAEQEDEVDRALVELKRVA